RKYNQDCSNGAQNRLNTPETIVDFFNRISSLSKDGFSFGFTLYQPAIVTLARCASFFMSAIPHTLSRLGIWTTS
ncbi:MAG TPA: hypothetical protein VN175_11730, partial [Rhizomicrobium sp.]|nr:hypothetical protein [Rhizomicrobium sp.]